MDMKSLYVKNLREAVKEGELFRTCDAIELFCREVLEYKKVILIDAHRLLSMRQC